MAYWVLSNFFLLVLLATTFVHADNFQVRWLNDSNNFRAGDTASIVVQLGASKHGSDSNQGVTELKNRFCIIVNKKEGNSTFISGVENSHDPVSSTWNITFVPILVGSYLPSIKDHYTYTSNNSLNFFVSPGEIHPAVCFGFWTNDVNEFEAGKVANVSILPKDAFGNIVTQINNDSALDKLALTLDSTNGSSTDISEVYYSGLDDSGCLGIGFKVSASGNFMLRMVAGNQTLAGFPLSFNVTPGPLNITSCSLVGKYEANALQIFSNLEVFIYQKDHYDNVVSGPYDFDVGVVDKAANLSLPVSDLQFKDAGLGIKLLSFSVSKPGDYVLTVYDARNKNFSIDTRYHYSVFIGYTYGLNSVVNGSGLAGSVAGNAASLFVYLQDVYYNPSPVELRWVRADIIRKSDSLKLPAVVTELRAPALGNTNPSGGNVQDAFSTETMSSGFNVTYALNKSGSYEIWVFCGNVPLNGGKPYIVEISPDKVDTSKSIVLSYVSRVMTGVPYGVEVKLMDGFLNPVTSQQSKLTFDTGLSDESPLTTLPFVDSGDGSYVGYYKANNTGNFSLSVLFGGKKLANNSFEINAFKVNYFPQAVNNTITVGENESIAFNVPEKDLFQEATPPHNGSLIRQGNLLRYTPYKSFFGNDSFDYTIRDLNNNEATGTVTISVYISPPQFVSLPNLLVVTEDVISPRFSGFTGFEIKYSDPSESISMHIQVQNGRLYLAPSPMQFWKPFESEFLISSELEGRNLSLEGCVQVLNYILKSLQYLGDENFHGPDSMKLTMRNKYGNQTDTVPIIVKPVNDAPFIIAPEYVVLCENDSRGFSKLFNSYIQEKHIIIDPDLNYYVEESKFIVQLSVEVNAGLIMTTLPANLANTTELIVENKYNWQPLLTFVAISGQFVIEGKGIRFHGSIKDCNNALQQLGFQGAKQAVLSIRVNDLGNYGCYQECLEDMSFPLQTEANIHLIRTKPMKSSISRFLAIIILVEFVCMILLGLFLLLFICKCARSLGYERSPRSSEIMLSDAHNFHNPVVKTETQNDGRKKGTIMNERLSRSFTM